MAEAKKNLLLQVEHRNAVLKIFFSFLFCLNILGDGKSRHGKSDESIKKERSQSKSRSESLSNTNSERGIFSLF